MEDLKRLLDDAGFDATTLSVVFDAGENTIYGLTRPGAGAVDDWTALRDVLAGRGWWPVVLGQKERIERIGEDLEFNTEETTPRGLVEQGLAVNLDAWLAEHAPDWDEMEDDEPEWEVDASPNTTFTVALDILTREPYDEVTIALVPAAEPWEVPAYLGIGGWNECPNPEVHVAFFKRWHDAYGAEIVGYTGDVVELRIARPISDAGEAAEVARVQYTYCSDIVDQGTGTLDALASTLLGATVWYFWWD